MASAIGVSEAINLHDGVSASVTLSGTPTGMLEFWAAEVADGPEFALPFTSSGTPGQYVVVLPRTNKVWAVWAKDDNGFGVQFGAVWIGVSDDPDVDAIGKWIRDRLTIAKPLMEACLQSWYPNTKLKTITYGFVGNIINFPSILIANPKYTWDWAATGFVSKWSYSFTIACMAAKSEEQTELPLVTRMAQAVMDALNIRRFSRFTLPNGLPLYYCMTREGDATEIQVEDNVFASVASCVWSGKALKQQGPARPGEV